MRGSPIEMIKVCILISSLERGGAERQVVEMVKRFDPKRVQVKVCSLSNKVPLADQLPPDMLHIIGKRRRKDLSVIPRVASFLRRESFDLVHSFLTEAEFVSRLAAPLAGWPAVVASERNSDYSYSPLQLLALRWTKPLFKAMIANSRAGKRFNVDHIGVPDSKIHVVHNGIDTEKFASCPGDKANIRERLGLKQEVPIVAMVGNFKKQKGHEVFLRMAGRLAKNIGNVEFAVIGGVSQAKESKEYHDEMRSLVESLDLKDRCHFLGALGDMSGVYNGFDLTALLSYHEGTPNVVLESFSCGVPVVVSDVADNAYIVENGKSGYVVDSGDWESAAGRAEEILRDRDFARELGLHGRDRVKNEFSLERVVERVTTIYEETLTLN